MFKELHYVAKGCGTVSNMFTEKWVLLNSVRLFWEENLHRTRQHLPFSGTIRCCCCFCRNSVRNPHPSLPRSDNSLSLAGSSEKGKIQHSRVGHEIWWQFYLQGYLPHPCDVWRELLCGLKTKKRSEITGPLKQSCTSVDTQHFTGYTSIWWGRFA